MDMGTRMLVALVVAALLLAAMAGPALAKTHAVDIRNNAFSPKELTIAAGDTVVWTNCDAYLHDVDFDSLGKSPGLHKDETWSKTFDRPGTYAYDCDIHPFMKGTVRVA